MATTRRLFRQGHSTVMTVPANILAHLDVRQGDEVELHLEPRKRVTIRKFHGAHTTSSTNPMLAAGHFPQPKPRRKLLMIPSEYRKTVRVKY